MKFCAFCGKELEIDGRVHRGDMCPHCNRDLHCCIQCEFYDMFAHNKCREPEAEWVTDRERSNFCDYFRFQGGKGEEKDRSEEAKKKLERLFGSGED